MGRLCVALAILVGSCIESGLVPCGTKACPVGFVCVADSVCAAPELVAACNGKLDGEACTTITIPEGGCANGLCHEVRCGDGYTDAREACDDSNTSSGDGCSGDCRSAEVCGNKIVDGASGEQCDSGIDGLSGDGCSSTCSNEVSMWLEASDGVDLAVVEPAIAFPSNGHTLVFGGRDINYDATDDTFEWDGISWIRRRPVASPPARFAAVMVFDAGRDRVVLFGGRDVTQKALADTWEWDGSNWIERTPTTSPPPRAAHMMAYDKKRSRVVLFGGSGLGFTGIGDTWEWDGTNWIETTPTESPSARQDAGMTYDENRERVVLCGGGGGSTTATGTWEYDGTSWTNVAPEPTPSYARMVYDPTRSASQLMLNGSMWEWNGTWTQRQSLNPPFAIQTRSAVYDTARSRIVLIGDAFAQGDVYELTTTWSKITPSTGPSMVGAMAYDAGRGRVVAVAMFNGTWEWDGDAWIRTGDPADTPSMASAVMTYDSVRDEVIGFKESANVSETWRWRASTWTKLAVAAPSPRQNGAIAFDAKRGRAVMFGGEILGAINNITDETWEWDGEAWTQLNPPTKPPARRFFGMAYDPIRDRTVLFGGNSSITPYMGDTWEWDGTTWAERTPTVSPPPRERHSLAYDPLRQSIVMTSRRGDVWDYDGITWRERALILPTPGDGPLVQDVTGALILGDLPSRLISVSAGGREQCTVTADFDGDELSGCADPDCWTRCTPMCVPGIACDPSLPHCGDGACSAVETRLLCPDDCP